MNTQGNPIPSDLTLADEAALLALIESPSASESAVGGRLASHPELMQATRQMRAQRVALMSIPSGPVPTGLVEAALARLDREAIQGLRLTHSTSELPVSKVPARPSSSGRRKIWEVKESWLAAAASLVLLLGAWGVYSMLPDSPARPAPFPGDIANSSASDGIPDPLAVPSPFDDYAINTEIPDDGLVSAAPDMANVTLAAFGPLLPDAGAALDVPRALELAREGRLVIRVTPRQPATVSEKVTEIAGRSRAGTSWSLSSGASPSLVALLTKPVQSVPSRPTAPEDRAIAGSNNVSGRGVLQIERPAPIEWSPLPDQNRVCVASVAPNEAALTALQRSLTEAIGSVEFAASESRVIDSAPLVSTPEAILWWNQPPSKWAPWLDVAVVVEQ
jgi:hypothetical protein